MADIEKAAQIGLVPAELINDLRQIIDSARSHVAATANYEVTMMNWNIGNRINRDVLNYERAEYGKQIVATVVRQLQEEYGTKGFDEKSIRRMMQFAQTFPDFQIVATLSRKLSWSHFVIVMPLKDELQREFYMTMAANERWSVRTLQAKIDGMLFERTAIATKPEELIKSESANLRDNDVMTPDMVFKSPYFLEFTGLKGMYSEKSLEDAASEFDVQGLELDWTCVVWDGDLRYTPDGWNFFEFNGGSKWNKIQKPDRQAYLINAYRVLLTRARQGMILCVPEGFPEDATRLPEFYNGTYEYLKSLGIEEI